jgi:hypothetical protein
VLVRSDPGLTKPGGRSSSISALIDQLIQHTTTANTSTQGSKLYSLKAETNIFSNIDSRSCRIEWTHDNAIMYDGLMTIRGSQLNSKQYAGDPARTRYAPQ